MKTKFMAVPTAVLAMLFLGGLAQVSQAQVVSAETLNLEPAKDDFDWTGTGPGFTNRVDMLDYYEYASGDEFTSHDECGPLMFYSCTLFSGKAPFVHADSSADFTDLDAGLWLYTTPGGPDSYVAKATSRVAHVTGESIFTLEPGLPFGATGLWDGDSFDEAEVSVKTEEFGITDVEGEPGIRQVAAGMVSGFPDPVPEDHWTGWEKLEVELGDGVEPVGEIDPNTVPDGWIDETPFQVGLEASDDGLGLRTAAVVGGDRDPNSPWEWLEGTVQAFGWIDECIGNTDDPCPAETPNGFAPTVDPALLPEGHSELDRLLADGGGGAHAAYEQPISIDTIDPKVDLAGSFMSAPGMVLTDPSYTLEVDATDGETGKENSGVVDLKVLIDDVVIDSDSQSCPVENCELDLSPTIDADDYSNGPHQLKVKATDAVGHVKTATVDFEVDR